MSTSETYNREITDLVSKLTATHGSEKVLSFLRSMRPSENDVLTIISNLGTHPVPQEMVRGETFVASTGQLDFSTIDQVRNQYEEILGKVASKLKERNWTAVYILPFGHITLSMQIKLLVQKVLSIETIDIFHLGSGKYDFLKISQRPLIVDAEATPKT